jgi:hypothetical protein
MTAIPRLVRRWTGLVELLKDKADDGKPLSVSVTGILCRAAHCHIAKGEGPAKSALDSGGSILCGWHMLLLCVAAHSYWPRLCGLHIYFMRFRIVRFCIVVRLCRTVHVILGGAALHTSLPVLASMHLA